MDLNNAVDTIEALLADSAQIIKDFKDKHNCKIAGYTCGIIPPEILSSLGLYPLKLPASICSACGTDSGKFPVSDTAGIYDLVILPESLRYLFRGNSSSVISFNPPHGYDEIAAHTLRKKILNLADTIGKDIDASLLKEAVYKYNSLRQIVRGIASARNEKPELLSLKGLSVIFESSLVLPHEMIMGHLEAIFYMLNEMPCSCTQKIKSLLYSGSVQDAGLLEEIENSGLFIMEDDSCSGRRQFDISYNPDADDILHEVIQNFIYRPHCCAIRPPAERYELLYRLLKNYGMEAVIFIDDGNTLRKEEIEFLRIRMMRDGIDPITGSVNTILTEIKNYMSKL